MIVVKLLSDREEIDTLHGRLIVGILLIQDIIVIIAMPFLSSMNAFFNSSCRKDANRNTGVGNNCINFQQACNEKDFQLCS